MMEEQIILERISKKYNGRYVWKDIDTSFEKGKSFAFMGHNGCGKSTLLKIIAGLVAPTTGRVIYNEPLHFAYVPEKFVPLKISARSYLWRMGEIEGLKKENIEKSIARLGEDFFVAEMLDISMQSLSKGTLQKIGVIQAIMKKPDVLLLDEPLSGQDIGSQKVFIHKINELRDGNTTVFMSCHEQPLVNAISDRVLTICDGNLTECTRKEEPIYAVILENPDNLPLVPGMERYGDGYRLLIKEGDTQKTILELLQTGWILKGMTDYDTTTTQI